MSEAKARELLQEVDGQLSRVLHEMAGSVSLCWTPKPTGVFDSTLACEFVAKAIEELRAIIRRDLAPVPAPPTEPRVPREPTEKMMLAGNNASPLYDREIRRIWRAMYDAAPGCLATPYSAASPTGEAK